MIKRLNITIVILAAVAAALISACSSSATPTPSGNSSAPTNSTSAPVVAVPTTAPTSAPAPSLTPAAAPTSASLLDAFTKAQAALTTAKTVRLTINSTANGKKFSAVFEYVNPDAYHMTQSDGTEIIAIKDKGAYEKKNGTWSKLTLPATVLDPILANVNPIAIVDKQRQQISAKYTPQIGADVLDAKPMVTYAYNGAISLGAGSPIVGSVKFWYGVTDGWLYKWTGSDTKGDSGTATIEYNIPITIKAPIP